jgi:excinuclease ABC subunit B
MAEDLSAYLQELNFKVHYLHSEVDTLERIEILRDLRKGVFDVLVGINLLREGLDLPEVSLVAILDADREGFLRSEGSLIQTVGRAARNLNGKAIMYADHVTGSMQRAIAETDRRRQKQLEFNLQHGIEPRSIVKEVRDVMDGARDAGSRRGRRAAEPRQEYLQLTPEQLARRISRMEKGMFEHARNLEFEDAARLRDELQALRRVELGLPADSAL